MISWMDVVVSALANGKVFVEEQTGALGLPRLLGVLLAAAAIFTTYSFVQSRKSRVKSSNAARASSLTEKDKNVNKNRELGGKYE